MAIVDIIVPRLPRGFERLRAYLSRRDTGPPDVAPAPAPLEQVDLSSIICDRIGWELPSSTRRTEYAPDGFIVWWAQELTGDPTRGGVRLSAAARSLELLWPADVDRSYAVCAFRNAHQGEQLGPKQQHPTWQVEGSAVGPWRPPSLADADAPNNSTYYSTTTSKLTYKDPGGTAHVLY